MFEMATPLAALFTAMGPRVFATPPPVDMAALVEAAEAAGATRGWAEAAAELQPLKAALATAIQAAGAAAVIDQMSLQPLFTTLVARVAAAVVDGELRQSPAGLERLVAAALAAVETDGTTMLRLSPRDAELLADVNLGVPTAIDPDLPDGDIRVDTPQHVIAASLSARLAEIVAGLA